MLFPLVGVSVGLELVFFVVCRTLLGITFRYREHRVEYCRLTAPKSMAWEMYRQEGRPYSHKAQEGL